MITLTIFQTPNKKDEEESDWFADFGATISDSSDSSFAKDLRASFGASSSAESASADRNGLKLSCHYAA